MRDSVLWLVSLASRARKVRAGAFLCERALQAGEAELVILAADAAQNTKKKFINSCKYYGITLLEYSDKENLAHFTGKENVSVIAVCDKNFASGINKAVLKSNSVNN